MSRIDGDCDSTLGDGTDFGDGECTLIRAKSDRLGVKVTAGQNRSVFDHDDRVIRHRVGLDLQHLRRLAQLFQAGPHHLWLAAHAVRVLDAIVVVAMRFANFRARQQLTQAVGGVDLALETAQLVNLGPKRCG